MALGHVLGAHGPGERLGVLARGQDHLGFTRQRQAPS
jgi:hypothetical protein